MNTKTVGLLAIALIVVVGVGIYSFSNREKKEVKISVPNTAKNTEVKVIFKDGIYEQMGDYVSPGGPEQIDVKLSLKNGVIVDSVVTPEATLPKSKIMQGIFAENYKQLVVGKSLKDLKLSKVAGSSLTPKGFNDALEKIKIQAKLS